MFAYSDVTITCIDINNRNESYPDIALSTRCVERPAIYLETLFYSFKVSVDSCVGAVYQT